MAAPGSPPLSNSSHHKRNQLNLSSHSRHRRPPKNRELDVSNHSEASASSSSTTSSSYVHNYKKRQLPSHSEYIALDCEMVGSYTGESICARVVLVDWKGRTVLDSYVAPTEPVADYRTYVSGITKQDLEGAPELDSVREEVMELLKDRILIGHALINDLQCLKVEHPWERIRDTALYEPFQQTLHGQMMPRKLKELVSEKLGYSIQDPTKPHSPVEDAVAALNLYKQHRPRWEACMSTAITKDHQERRRQQYLMQQHQYYTMMMQPTPALPNPMLIHS